VAEAVVEGSFESWDAFLKDRGLPEEQPVVLRRELSSAGRSRAWINGGACNLADLREAGRIWVRLTSQHDHQSLLQEDRHLALFDEVLGLHPALDLEAESVREAEAQLKARRRNESERERRLEQLAEQLADLDKLDPKAGEWVMLRSEREPLRHAAQLEQAYREAAEALREVIPSTEVAQRSMARSVAVYPEAQRDLDRLRSVLLELEDLHTLSQDQALRWSKEGVERLETVESRLASYEKLARRHHCEPEELHHRQQELRVEQRAMMGSETPIAELEHALAHAAEIYRVSAEALHQRRENLLSKLERETHARLGYLGMVGARLQVRLTLAGDPTSPVMQQGHPVRVSRSGFSTLSFWIETNPGEGFRPLAKIASGGELSRVMLALTGAGMTLDPKGDGLLTLVLDEVDAGIGGETALAVGAAIRELGQRYQVLAATHLAQVASRAEHHGCIRKLVDKGRTRSQFTWLFGEERLRELARLLSGHPDGAEAQAHARVLLSEPQNEPQSAQR
jgi:DNA repair protein RecN (Recombination protein N)